MAVYDVNTQQEVYRVGAALKLAKQIGLLIDAAIVAAGIKQIVTVVFAGTVGGSGAGTVILNVKATNSTALNNSGSGKNISFNVANNDTATQAAVKARTALNADTDVTAFFTVGGTGVNVTLTVINAVANDTAMHVNYANGTATGLTNANSTITTDGQGGVAGMRLAIAAGTLPVGGSEMERQGTLLAFNRGVDQGVFTDASIDALTTVDGLIDLTGIAASYKARMWFD